MSARFVQSLAALCLLASPGCATYSDKIVPVRSAVDVGDYATGVQLLDEMLDVKDGALPESLGDDDALILLERGTLYQALGEWRNSSRDLQVADKELELLDIAGDTAGNIGKYVYSDDSGNYRGSPTEKLCLNSVNMLNYVALGDLSGARVESKRFNVMRTYLKDYDPDSAHGPFGSYVAGFVSEQLGEYGPAMRYYDEALAAGPLESLREPVGRLAEIVPYRGQHLADFIREHPAPGAAEPNDGKGELLVVVGLGRVPYKVPERVPVGAVVGIAGSYISGDAAVLERSVFKVVVYPELTSAPETFTTAKLRLDERPVSMDQVGDLGAELRREYEAIKPQIIGAAISRMLVRAGAAEAARVAGDQSSDGLGTALALILEAFLVAADKPDTRSWSVLPRRIFVYRERVVPGTHDVVVALGGNASDERSFQVEIPAGGYGAVIWTVPR